MISLGVIASGLVSGGPPPEPPYGVLKIIREVFARDSSNFVEGYELPALAPSIDMLTGQCTDIYQSYRVIEDSVEVDQMVAIGVDGGHAICYSYTTVAVYVTPCNANETIVPDSTTWESTCTLVEGTTVAKIPADAGCQFFGITIIQSGKFLLHSKVFGGAPSRILNVPIVNYTTPADATALNVVIDLDDIGIPSDYHFNYTGCAGTANDYLTGELVLAMVVLKDGTEEYLYFTVNVDSVTGEISNLLLNTASPLGGLTEINDNSFETGLWSPLTGPSNLENYGSIGNTLARYTFSNPTDTLETWTYTTRQLSESSPYTTVYVDAYEYDTFNSNTAINNKLVNLGYTLASGASGFQRLHCYTILS